MITSEFTHNHTRAHKPLHGPARCCPMLLLMHTHTYTHMHAHTHTGKASPVGRGNPVFAAFFFSCHHPASCLVQPASQPASWQRDVSPRFYLPFAAAFCTKHTLTASLRLTRYNTVHEQTGNCTKFSTHRADSNAGQKFSTKLKQTDMP